VEYRRRTAKALGKSSDGGSKNLLFRKSECIFVAFDLLYLNAQDLRALPLIERKRQLRTLLGVSIDASGFL
jgi:ATP-dependent DNA ligase